MITFADGEEVVLEVRRHWIVLVPQFILVLALALAPVGLYALLSALPIAWEVPGSKGSLLVYLGAAWALLVWVVGFTLWIDYYLDIWILTDRRLLDVDQKGLFRREVSSLRFEKIQDITAEVDGLLATYLGFGDIRVQTAGETREFVITNVHAPQKMVDCINGCLDRQRQGLAGGHAATAETIEI